MNGNSGRILLVSVDFLNEKLCILEDGKPSELYIQPRLETPVLGSIYLGKIQNVIPGLQAVFVDIGRPKNAYMYVKNKDDIKNYKKEQYILVQIIREETSEKGVRITDKVSLPGKYVVFFPYDNFVKFSRKLSSEEKEQIKEYIKNMDLTGGFIFRTASAGRSYEELEQDIYSLLKKWEFLQYYLKNKRKKGLVYKEDSFIFSWLRDALSLNFEKIIIDEEDLYKKMSSYVKCEIPYLKDSIFFEKGDLFEIYDVYRYLKRSLRYKVWLKSGGYILIRELDFMTCIDVNSGKYEGKKEGGLQDTAFRINLEAAKTIAREIRLRNISGIIVIDFIDMNNRGYEDNIVNVLSEELSKSLLKSMVYPFNELGLVHIVRKRKYKNLKRIFLRECPKCNFSGFLYNEDYRLLELKRQLLALCEFKKEVEFFVEVSPLFQKTKLEFFKVRMKKDYDIYVNFNVNENFCDFKYVIHTEKRD